MSTATILTVCMIAVSPVHDRAHNMTTAYRTTMPCLVKKPEPVLLNYFMARKLAAKPVATIEPVTAKPAKRAQKHKAKKRKATCRKGQKLWYWNKKKGRKMYRIRRSC